LNISDLRNFPVRKIGGIDRFGIPPEFCEGVSYGVFDRMIDYFAYFLFVPCGLQHAES
jgi:hypothetical protein